MTPKKAAMRRCALRAGGSWKRVAETLLSTVSRIVISAGSWSLMNP